MNAIIRLRVLGLATLVLALAPLSFGQPGRIRVDVLARLASDGAHAGSRVYAALEVELEQGYHVNSNQPLDDFLIPTVLTLDLPTASAYAPSLTPTRSSSTRPAKIRRLRSSRRSSSSG